jgi:FkbM family methyltransferase
MTDGPVCTAASEGYRRPSRLEGAAVLGRRLAAGPLRGALRAAYHAALHLASGGRGIASTLPGGETVRVHPAYRFMTWNAAEYDAFRAAVRPGAVALDVGANVGAYALLLGQWVRPGGRVFAFEPAPGAFAGLARHVEMNGVAGTVACVRAAVSSSSGRAALLADGLQGTNRLSGSGGAAPATPVVEVETVSLDDFCARERIDPTFVKVDVEGAELEVLRGMRETVRRMGERLSLFVEMHPTLWRGSGIGVEDVKEEMELQGLAAVPLRGEGDPWALEGECVRLVRR